MKNQARSLAIAQYQAPRLFIDGSWIGTDGRRSADVLDPATGTSLGHVPHANAADLDRAIAAAENSFGRWSRTPAIERSRVMRRAAGWLRERREEWAALITLELGKPIDQARIEVTTACEMLEWAAEEGRRLYGRQIPPRVSGMRMTAFMDPVGPVAAISGWNAPAITPARKIAGALAAGCSIVAKPSEATPASALMLARAFEAAELPVGVLNMVFGDAPSIGHRFATDSAIRMITFTGGTAVGKHLGALCTGTMKRMVLELGGHAPAVIFADVDVDAVARAAVAAKFRNSGQICTSPTRILVQTPVFESFVARFIAAVSDLRVGDPFEPDTQMGPLQNAARVSAVRSLIDDAVARGGSATAGMAPDASGFWQPPTVLVNVPASSRVCHEEPFGPIALIAPFSSFEDAITESNRLSMGLAAYAFTNDLRTAERLARELQSGTLAINHWAASFPETPFGGLKDSGFGTEGGSEGVAAFLQARFVSVAS